MKADKSRRRKGCLFRGAALAASTLVALLVCEGAFQFREWIKESGDLREGPGGRVEADPRWGWRPSQGRFHWITPEYDMTGEVNAWFMNDGTGEAHADPLRTRILALGDSHTFAIGVSADQTWVQRLERRLNATENHRSFRCYNAAAIGYSLHQYLLRLIDQGPTVRPHYVVVGLSFGTDLYDLLPPDRGGWIYGGQQARDYFDFGPVGELKLRHWVPAGEGAEASAGPVDTTQKLRRVLRRFATFRFLRTSRPAMSLRSRLRIGGQTLWSNLEVALEREISPRHEYQWRLALALLERINEEAQRLDAELIVVGIPHATQVRDDVWEATFGDDDRLDRSGAGDRIRSFCEPRGISYVDTLDAFRAAAVSGEQELHYRHDGHPTAEGQDLIAEILSASGIFRPSGEDPTNGPRRGAFP